MREEISNIINSSPLDQISLENLDIQDNEFEEIVDLIIQKRPMLKLILLGRNNITDISASILTNAFSQLSQLEFLDLEFNYITRKGAEEIFKLLSTHPTLNIAFHGNGIIDEEEMETLRRNASFSVKKFK